MSTLVDLLKSSVVTQGVITIITLVIWGVLLIQGRVIPIELNAIVTLVIGFYFGSKVGMYQGINQERTKERV